MAYWALRFGDRANSRPLWSNEPTWASGLPVDRKRVVVADAVRLGRDSAPEATTVTTEECQVTARGPRVACARCGYSVRVSGVRADGRAVAQTPVEAGVRSLGERRQGQRGVLVGGVPGTREQRRDPDGGRLEERAAARSAGSRPELPGRTRCRAVPLDVLRSGARCPRGRHGRGLSTARSRTAGAQRRQRAGQRSGLPSRPTRPVRGQAAPPSGPAPDTAPAPRSRRAAKPRAGP